VLQHPAEEPARRRRVPLVGGQHVDDLPELVDRPVQVAPPTGHLDVRLVHPPPVAGRVLTGPSGVGEQRGESLHPAEDGDVVDLDAALGEQLLHVPVRQAVPEVPANRDRDHLRWEPEAGEGRPVLDLTGPASTHPPSLPHHEVPSDQPTQHRRLPASQHQPPGPGE